MENSRTFMKRAFELAELGLFTTTPNPRVGCVLVRNGKIIGEGYTQPAGGHHAEIRALLDARNKKNETRGATAYVTLEPCSHQGRTPPCVDALIEAGISKVVATMEDPNPLVSGKGFARLREAGIEVASGTFEKEARELNLGFFSRMERGRPWVRAKVASSADGVTSLMNGESKWITSQAAREDGHYWRARACAIMTGIRTVRSDDPQMNVRAVTTMRQPKRIVLDSRLRIGTKSKILGSDTIVFSCEGSERKIEELKEMGCEVVMVPETDSRVDLNAVMKILNEREINELHVEAGPTLNAALMRTGLIDEIVMYLAPCVLGRGRGAFDIPALHSLQDKFAFCFNDVKMIGDDVRLIMRRVV